MRKASTLAFAIAIALLYIGAAPAVASDTWTGEVLDKGCYDTQGAHGPDHADCAKSCLERGGEMGLLTADGEVYILRAGDDAAPFEALKAMGGENAKIMGELTDDAGNKVIIVTGAESAD
jgi:hypothetical protein